MARYIFKFVVFFIAVFLLMPTLFAGAKECCWYVKRNSEHEQPLCDGHLSFVEELGGVYVDRLHSDVDGEKVIYLTFDAGYENGNVESIVDALDEEGVKGSFFILKHLMDSSPSLVKKLSDNGHCVCNHTMTHKNMVGFSKDQIAREILGLEEQYKKLTGREMSKFFRPPEGTFDAELLRNVNELGYRTVLWSFAYADWDNEKQVSESEAMDLILKNIHNGEIMLLHPTSKTNASIIKELIRELKGRGFRFATLDQL